MRLCALCEPDDPRRLRIAVHDSGAGLSRAQLEQRFQAFNRLGRESQQFQRTGIGLVIAKRLVQAVGGRLEVSSEPGRGSCFAVVLLVADDTSAPADAGPATAAGRLAETLRANPTLDLTHCVAVTADATAGTAGRRHAAGFEEDWTKPLDLQAVSVRLKRLLERPRATARRLRVGFDDVDALDRLEAATPQPLCGLQMGVVRMNAMGMVIAHNRYESAHAGLGAERVPGRNFFGEIARCAHNDLAAGRLREEPELDVVPDCVFALRMRTTALRLRLLRSARAAHRHRLVQRER